MLVKFFNRGTGSGKGAVNYLTRATDPITKKLREPAPEVLRFGNPSLTADLIDSLKFQHKYRSGVLSFAPEDTPSEKEQQKLIDDFEAIAFAGIEDNNRNILWVRHQHTGSNRIELHFLTPRVELSTGKSLNIAPPGWRSYFQPWQDKWNLQFGWARPDDPRRARANSPTHTAFEAKRNQQQGQPSKDEIRNRVGAMIREEFARGKIKSRPDVLKALQNNGYEVVRAAQKSITIKNPSWQGNPQATGAKIRLKSQIYYEDWDVGKMVVPPKIAPAEEIAKLEAELKQKVVKRQEFNQQKYPQPQDAQGQINPKDYLCLQDFMEAALGERSFASSRNNQKAMSSCSANSTGGTPATFLRASTGAAIALRLELQQLKQDINLVEFALAYGYTKNAKRSTNNSIRLEHPNGERMIVKPDPGGIDTYFSTQNSTDNGTVIDFIYHRQNLALREIRQLLKDYSVKESRSQKQRTQRALISPVVEQYINDTEAQLKAESERRQQEQWQQSLQPIKSHQYLIGERKIFSKTLSSGRFYGQVFKDERNNAVFPYTDGERITGYELRNQDFQGFQKGGKKSLWLSNHREEDTRLVIVESPIDAMSYHQLNPHRDNRYLATGGTISNNQKELIKQQFNLVNSRFAEVIIATDNDEAGDKLAAELTPLFEDKATRVKPKLKDWNEDLIVRLQRLAIEQARQKKTKRSRGISR